MSSGKPIDVTLDPSLLRASIELWREATDMTIPIHDSFKIHFMANRRPMLINHERTARAWGAMLRAMTSSTDAAALDELRAAVDGFREWAVAELKKLDELAAGD